MNRRGFLTLLGSAGAVPLGKRRRRPQEAQEWRFALDSGLRWSLLPPNGPAVIAGADVAARLDGGTPVPLGALTEVRRLRGGERGAAATTVIGRAGDVEIGATFSDGTTPAVTVRARGLGEARRLDELWFLDVPVPVRRSAGGAVRAWINGPESWSDCRVVEVDRHTEATGHWQLALHGAGAVALAFGEDDAGLGAFTIAGGRLTARSRMGGRVVSASLPPAAATLTILPGEGPLAALGDHAARSASPRPLPAPAGWSSWHARFEHVAEDDVLAALALARDQFDPRSFRVIRLDDGYQRTAGDWNTNARFPRGHRWLVERIHEAGFAAGLWLAPFAVTERSGIPAAHPEWLLRGAGGRPVPLDDRPHWGGPTWGLDAAQREVQDFLRDLARHATTEWGYDHLALDFLHHGLMGAPQDRGRGPAEACRAGLIALRQGAGRAFVAGSGAPLQLAPGLVDSMRVGGDARANWDGVRTGARPALLRSHLAAVWHNDPGAVVLREPLTLAEARSRASLVAASGGVMMCSDHLPSLPPDRLAILRRTIPVAAVRPMLLDLAPARGGPAGQHPPAALLARAADDWWTLVLVNWDGEPQRLRAPLGATPARGPLAVYDVWDELRRPDVQGAVSLTVAPHAAAVLGLRRPRRHPFVVGTTRHVVQGAVDLAGETWDAGRRVLSGRSARLDRSPYAITIAVPPGHHPRACRADVGCEVTHPHGAGRAGAVRLEFRDLAEEIEWEVAF